MVERTHVSTSPDPITVEPRTQIVPGLPLGKPAGFWYEVDADWRRWTLDEHGSLHGHLHGVDLGDTRVLTINTVEALDDFNDHYGLIRYGYVDGIEWVRVAAYWDGIEIAPYRWDRRLALGFTWYYGWDCASGVIWRPRNVTVTYLGPVEVHS